MEVSELLDELGIHYCRGGEHHHVNDGWYGLDCPFCSPGSGRFRMGIPVDSLRVCVCWVCGQKRSGEALALASGRSLPEVLDLMGVVSDRAVRKARPTGKYTPPPGVGKLLKCHREYLRSRGFDPKEIRRLWGVGGIGLQAELAWRLFIPIRTTVDKPVSWTTRSISDNTETPYLSAKPEQESTHLRDVLYGAERASHGIIITEGPLDAWAIGAGGTATLGVGYSPAQLRFMSEYAVRCVCFDAETDAQRRAATLCQVLQLFPGKTTNVTLESGKDASRASRRELNQLRRLFLR